MQLAATSAFADGATDASTIVVGPVAINRRDYCAAVGDRTVWFTPRELEVLLFLAERAGHPVPRDAILLGVWGTSVVGFKDRSVEVYIGKVRRKLTRACPRYEYIHTHFNVGYRFEPELLREDGS